MRARESRILSVRGAVSICRGAAVLTAGLAALAIAPEVLGEPPKPETTASGNVPAAPTSSADAGDDDNSPPYVAPPPGQIATPKPKNGQYGGNVSQLSALGDSPKPGEPQRPGSGAGGRPERQRVTGPPKPETPPPKTPLQGRQDASQKKTPSADQLGDVVALTDARGFRCTGVLVAPAWVLTARHCVPVTQALFGSDVKRPSSTHKVTDSRVPDDKSVDAALVKIDPPTKVAVRERRTSTSTQAPAGSLVVAGFGARERTGALGKGMLRSAEVPVFGWGCDASRVATTGCRQGSEMVLGKRGLADTCAGDSGGPVFERANGGLRLLAITSRRVPGGPSSCGDGGIYTRVDTLAGFIDKTLGTKKEKP